MVKVLSVLSLFNLFCCETKEVKQGLLAKGFHALICPATAAARKGTSHCPSGLGNSPRVYNFQLSYS
jgi:hypothetical protein